MRSIVLSLVLGLASTADAQDMTFTPAWPDARLAWGASTFQFHPSAKLGIRVIDATPELRRFFGAPADAGVLVSLVPVDQPAARAGVRVGDVLLSIDGERIAHPVELFARMLSRRPGQEVTVELVRNRRRVSVVARLEDGFDFDFSPSIGPPPGPAAVDLVEQLRQLEERIRRLEEARR